MRKLEWLAGGGQMADVITAIDWSRSPLGPIDAWPQSLRTTVSLCLASNFPINIIWGEGHNQIYNDGYRVVCGAVHPRAMGEDYRVTWASAWPAIGEPFERALAGETSYLENQRMFLERNGYPEETFFTFSLSPIRDESGKVVGLFHPVTETTATMLAERRTRALRDIADTAGGPLALEEACERLLTTLEKYVFDLPFTLLYLTTPDASRAVLHGARGIDRGSVIAPETIDLSTRRETAPETMRRVDTKYERTWPLSSADDAGRVREVTDVSTRFGDVVAGQYPEPIATSFVVPIRVAGVDAPLGFLIVGASPRLPLDEAYRAFIEILGAAATTALGNARAYEAERQRSEALAELDRAKTAFFSNVSHELRTPLTLILGPVEDALGRGALDGESLNTVHRSALRLLRLVNSLLDFSRIEAGRLRSTFRETDICAFTAGVAGSFRSLVEPAGVKLVVDCASIDEAVFVDRAHWEKIVLNLISNAFKFTFRGEIVISLRAQGGNVVLSVRDTGVGIPADQLPKIFDRFHRVEGAQGRSFEGTGIGLALVSELAKAHGGTVHAESTVGKGSTFIVAFPTGARHLPQDQVEREETTGVFEIAESRGSPFTVEASQWNVAEAAPGASDASLLDSSTPDSDADPSLGVAPSPRADGDDEADDSGDLPPQPGGDRRPCVLVVDDNADMRRYLARLLATQWRVELAADGEAALKRIREARPDLVLSDVMMPIVDGVTLLRTLRADRQTKEIPVILLSARAGEDALLEGLETGADDYMVKPFSARELLARVQTHMTMARMRREWALEREQASRVSQAKSDFLRLVSHEFRSPLAALTLQLARLSRGHGELKLSEPQREVFARMSRTSRRLTDLVESLLTYARIESGRWDPVQEPFDAVRLAREVVDDLRPDLGDRPISLTVNPGATESLIVVSDPGLIRLVLTNLVGNAIKFTSRGHIDVSIDRAGDDFRFAVEDTGPGIPSAEHARVFEPFEQVEQVDYKHLQGFGLGLALVREMVTALDGRLELRSEVGAGSTFAVSFALEKAGLSE